MNPIEPLPGRYTPPAYFALEAASERWHEYIDGEVFGPQGETQSHNLNKGNLVAALRPGIRQRGYQAFSTSV